ncbi:hypothetical protein EsDP_00006955 [Epichloe bromicola]|uniref:Uncharacterized protein n=1 Tax=Epichloe bromicola TaxID=79588 RepID=A0ABQ0CZ49_9HYPO
MHHLCNTIPRDKSTPLIHVRDERQRYGCEVGSGKFCVAIDDGGLQLFSASTSQLRQVAILEAKRGFERNTHGSPILTDHVLAQIAGEVLALKRNAEYNIARDDFVVILAIAQRLNFLHFRITDDLIAEFETEDLMASDRTIPIAGQGFLRMDSTGWPDLKHGDHRREAVMHILALMSWADKLASQE